MAPTGIHIRAVDGRKERDTLDGLQKLCLPHDPKYPTRTGYWWIAYDGKRPVGFAGLTEVEGEPGVGYLTRAGVIPEYRGRRIQARLIRVRLQKARKMGWKVVLTTTYDNPASANNLIREGFRMYLPEWEWMCKGTLYWKHKLNG